MSTFRNPFFAARSSSRNASTRTRNPRFAPESLDRRLSPSDFGIAPAFEVSSFGPMFEAPDTFEPIAETVPTEVPGPLPTDPNGDPIPMPAPTPIPGPGGPL